MGKAWHGRQVDAIGPSSKLSHHTETNLKLKLVQKHKQISRRPLGELDASTASCATVMLTRLKATFLLCGAVERPEVKFGSGDKRLD